MSFTRAVAGAAIALLIASAVVSCEPTDQKNTQSREKHEQPVMHNGFAYEPLTSDSVIWRRTQYTKDATGEEWLQGISASPDKVAAWRGCPCCPVAYDSGGCCLPCGLNSALRYEGTQDQKDLVKTPTALITIDQEFPAPGIVFAVAAVRIVRDPGSTDPVECRFALTMNGREAMKSEEGTTEQSRVIPPASEIGGHGKWIQLQQQFPVDSAASSFSLSGRAVDGTGGDVAEARLISLTYIPKLN